MQDRLSLLASFALTNRPRGTVWQHPHHVDEHSVPAGEQRPSTEKTLRLGGAWQQVDAVVKAL